MSDTTHNLTLDILKQLHAGFAAMRSQFAEMQGRFTDMAGRLERLETIALKHRRDSAGMLVMMQATAGDFDARVSEVEERVVALENPKN